MFRIVIPARFGSTRLPGKPLLPMGGKPMIQHVYERARRSGAAEVWVATDDERIEQACRSFGAAVMMTGADHASGTDRVAELARHQGWHASDIIVGVQADEPLLPPVLINQLASLLVAQPDAGLATLATPVLSLEEFLNPNVTKVVVGLQSLALYFSRAPIPWARDGAAGTGGQTQFDGALRHLGLYAHRMASLQRLAQLPPSVLEQTEKLEQLRALEHGIKIVVAVAAEVPPAGVDTEEDLVRVEKAFARLQSA